MVMWAQGEDRCFFTEGWWSYVARRTLWNWEHTVSMCSWMEALPRHTSDSRDLCSSPSKDHSSSDPYLDIFPLLWCQLWWREVLSVEVNGSKHDFCICLVFFPHKFLARQSWGFPQLRQKLTAVKELLFTFHTAAPFFILSLIRAAQEDSLFTPTCLLLQLVSSEKVCRSGSEGNSTHPGTVDRGLMASVVPPRGLLSPSPPFIFLIAVTMKTQLFLPSLDLGLWSSELFMLSAELETLTNFWWKLLFNSS